MSPELYPMITQQLFTACAPAGFDLVQPLQVGWYNDAVKPEYRLPDFGHGDSLAVLIGNTRALWQPLVAAVHATPTLAADANPVDRYTVERIHAIMTELMAEMNVAWELRFAFEGPPRLVAMQKLAQMAGLAYQSQSYLSVHPVYGPWIALRAVVVMDVPGPPGPAPVLAPPCRCDSGCMPAFRQAMEIANDRGATYRTVSETWRAWVAVRDACPIGREHRYSEAQIRYHYTKDRQSLDQGSGEG